MVKIAVISDLHLGFGFDSEREKDVYVQAAEAFNKALSQDPDFILLVGDLFHKKIPSPETLGKTITFFKEANKQLNKKLKILVRKDDKLVEKGKIPAIICIYGTHERRNTGKTNPVHILQKANLLHCLHKNSILTQINGQRIGIHGLSGVHDKFAKEELKKWSPKPFDKATNLFLIHQTFNDIIPTKNKEFLEFKDLPEGFDLYLLGHIHWNIEEKHPSTSAPILVPGSTVRTQLRSIESKIKKGIYLVNIVQGKIKTKFIPIETRPFIFEKINVEKQKPSEIITLLSEKLSKTLEKDYSKKPLIRYILEGTLSEGFLPVDLQVISLSRRFKDKAIVHIDTNKVNSSNLKRRQTFLRKIIDKKESIDEIGIELLFKSLNSSNPIIEELFDSLSSNDLERSNEIVAKLNIQNDK